VRLLFLLVLLLAPAAAGETPFFRLPYSFWDGPLRVEVVGAEVTPDKRNFLVHAVVTETSGAAARVSWQRFFQVLTGKGQTLRPPTDAGVDRGGGLTRTLGSFEIQPREKLRMLIYFPVYPEEFPLRLRCLDGAISQEEFR
jgi:hypothetical protein